MIYVKSDQKVKIKKISINRRDPQFFLKKITFKSL